MDALCFLQVLCDEFLNRPIVTRARVPRQVLATLDDDGAVNCISPDMSGNAAATSANAIDNWQQVIYRAPQTGGSRRFLTPWRPRPTPLGNRFTTFR